MAPQASPCKLALSMPAQDLARPFRDHTAPRLGADRAAFALRLAVALVVVALTAGFGREMVDILAKGGLSVLEIVMAVSFIASFFWIALSAINALAGAAMIATGLAPGPTSRTRHGRPHLGVALLVPTFNEEPNLVFGNAVAVLKALEGHATDHRFSLFILSDTTDPVILAREAEALRAAQMEFGAACPIHYRHRANNIGRKAGNITDWCRGWGGGFDAFVVLDADSLMSDSAIVALADALAADSSVGLIQSVPRLIKAETLFGRMQQFATAAYGLPLAAGQALWSRGEGNYWGHNAIIRTRAFAASAGLPQLPGRRPFGGSVMSHDFVEAALLRRAGWRVRMLPALTGSFEETPPTLVDNALRDRRWCQGNLQHLGVVGAAGLHSVSRFHLLQGVMAYVSSFLWLMFLAAGTALALQAGAMPVDYFPEPYMFFPSWPLIDSERAMTLLLMTIAVLLVPKLAGIAIIIARRKAWSTWGGLAAILGSAMAEIVLSALIAPILMVQNSIALLRTLAGFDTGWRPQQRRAGGLRLGTLVRFHLAETVIGLGLCAAMAAGLTPLWLAPIAVSLAAAVPISALTSIASRRPRSHLFAVPERLDPPHVLQAAMAHGTEIGRAATAAEMPALMSAVGERLGLAGQPPVPARSSTK
ncbi:MAG: glucans biosynthesis glucosyltransferase MdoH [Rhizobiales bacterium]|nr:glucans biosynthesis glucosyltransferase MdoH [Hyphomicrobiales bacterium]